MSGFFEPTQPVSAIVGKARITLSRRTSPLPEGFDPNGSYFPVSWAGDRRKRRA